MRLTDLRRHLRDLLAQREALDNAIVHAAKLIEYEEKWRSPTVDSGAPMPVVNGSDFRLNSIVRKRPSNGYPYSGTMAEKILFAIKESGRFLHRSEIEEYMSSRESINGNTLSYNLSTMYRDGTLFRARFNRASHLICYGLPHMVSPGLDGKHQFSDAKYAPDLSIKSLKTADPATMVISKNEEEAEEHA